MKPCFMIITFSLSTWISLKFSARYLCVWSCFCLLSPVILFNVKGFSESVNVWACCPYMRYNWKIVGIELRMFLATSSALFCFTLKQGLTELPSLTLNLWSLCLGLPHSWDHSYVWQWPACWIFYMNFFNFKTFLMLHFHSILVSQICNSFSFLRMDGWVD